jgi:hypothetical protein
LSGEPTLPLVRTNLEGFPHSYGRGFVELLNAAYGLRSFTKYHLDLIGQRVGKVFDRGYRSLMRNPSTSDGYDWFAGLEFRVSGGVIRVLFPWTQQLDNFAGMDRSIAVHSDQALPTDTVSGLLRTLAERMTSLAKTGRI